MSDLFTWFLYCGNLSLASKYTTHKDTNPT